MIPLHDDNPTTHRPVVTIALIGACVLVFLWQFGLDEHQSQRQILRLGMIPAVLFGKASLASSLNPIIPELTVLTSMFMHGGFMHLAGNMLFLWIFGNNVEDAMGSVRYLAFYGLCGVGAALSQGMIDPDSRIPMIGASGAVSGVLGAYFLLHPRARVLTLIWLGFFVHLIRLPAVLVLGGWIAMQLFNALTSDPNEGGVAWYAHIGGFVAGIVLLIPFKRRHIPLFDRGRHQGPWS